MLLASMEARALRVNGRPRTCLISMRSKHRQGACASKAMRLCLQSEAPVPPERGACASMAPPIAMQLYLKLQIGKCKLKILFFQFSFFNYFTSFHKSTFNKMIFFLIRRHVLVKHASLAQARRPLTRGVHWREASIDARRPLTRGACASKTFLIAMLLYLKLQIGKCKLKILFSFCNYFTSFRKSTFNKMIFFLIRRHVRLAHAG